MPRTAKQERSRARDQRLVERSEAKKEKARLRRELRLARRRKRALGRVLRSMCAAGREQARGSRRDGRRAMLERHARERQALALSGKARLDAARQNCTTAKQTAKASISSRIERARHAIEQDRAYRAEIRAVRAARRHEGKEQKKRHAHERRFERQAESDDEVRRNIDPGLVGFFDSVRRSIRGSDRRTRTEAFLEYLEENPAEYVEFLERTGAAYPEESREEYLERTGSRAA